MGYEGSIGLNWVNKKGALIYENDRPIWVDPEDIRVKERRSLIYVPELSTNPDASNVVVQGDNLIAMNSLLGKYKEQVRLIYIDPPYNTQNTFEHYDDNLAHSEWLTSMRDRLQLAKKFLDPKQGSIWIQVDDDEQAYLKVLCDEVFGRKNFVSSIVWQKGSTRRNDNRYVSGSHDYILIYASNKPLWKRNLVQRNNKQNAEFTNPNSDPRGPWKIVPLTCPKTAQERPNLYYPLTDPITGIEYACNPSRVWAYKRSTMEQLIKDDKIWFPKTNKHTPQLKKFRDAGKQGLVPVSWWDSKETGSNAKGKTEIKKLFPNSFRLFDTPKPERLIERIITIGSNPGELVMDFFAGSGTTGVVAHRMGRRSIMIEKGEHAESLITPRFYKLFNGESIYKGKATPGDVAFYRLGPSVIDKYGLIDGSLALEAIAEFCLLNLRFTPTIHNSGYFIGQHETISDSYAVARFTRSDELWTSDCTRFAKSLVPENASLAVYTNCPVVDIPTDNISFYPLPAVVLRQFAKIADQGGDNLEDSVGNLNGEFFDSECH